MVRTTQASVAADCMQKVARARQQGKPGKPTVTHGQRESAYYQETSR